MITPLVEESLVTYLQGHRSADDAKQILRLIDENQRNGGALEAEFDSVLHKVSQKIPGLTLDFEKLLSNDPIECDPLISQGNLAILRLDNIYRQAYLAWMQSGSALQTIKRINKPANPATYSESTQQQIRTDETYPPDAQILNQVVNITLSGFRIQATITHRREHLKTPPVSREPARSTPSPSQPEVSARNAAKSTSLSDSNPDLIGADEILNSDMGDLSKPIDGSEIALIRGVNKISLLKGYDGIEPLTKTQPIAQPSPAESPTTVAFRSAKDRPANDNAQASSPNRNGAPCSDGGTPRSEHEDATNTMLAELREEEPVTVSHSAPSASPRETKSFTHNQPLYHKRE